MQGVGFRFSAQRKAQELGLTGWVRNLPDGRVEAELEGDNDAVQAMIAWCRKGPALARVTDVVVTPKDAPAGHESFELRF